VTLKKKADSTSSMTTLEGKCPGLGSAWISFAPENKNPVLSKVEDVRAALKKFDPMAKGLHKKP